ncbi:serine/threonine-protein kinase [Streptantibioticus silvisoli]|uniref:non-specific serine/threonine protein kinase n=1 Tax=Streptantibioticus silvisoli TaxID=2705255 RepID=A0ABT6W031_9ACTN|nr:serine/threonine-protein kinase [Streptantibioticus silvisoli]MDI5964109.1 serine/threonine-protein kinase [Streptantibioticus silvisoli]
MDADSYAEMYRPGTGDLIDERYELTESLGKGGMAHVWRAREASAGREVAVKFLRHDSEALYALDPHERAAELAVRHARFRREATLLGTLDHPGITALYGSGSHRGVPYIAMRLVTGVSLRTFLDEHTPLPPATAIAVAVQVAGALACAHTLPVVHRDLKPPNIMIDDEGAAVLIDFGIAKPLRADATRYTAHGSTLGTRGYLAPEQLLEREPTARTDVYCFGCVFYELLTGRPPFPLGADAGLTERHLYEEPLPPSLYAAGIPEAIDDLVIRMLAKQPGRRPPVDEVLEVLAPLGPQPGDPEPRPRTHPDPTAPLRRPADRTPCAFRAPCEPPATASAAGEEEWLDARAVELLCTRAESEIAAGESGEATGRLRELAERARGEWGERRPLVRRVWRGAADGLRLAGDFGSAARLYQGIDDGLLHGDGPAERAERAVVRLRLAECRLAFGELETAVATVDAAGHTAAGLPRELAIQVESVRHEVDVQLSARFADTNDRGGPGT